MNKGKNKSEFAKIILEEVGKTLILSTAIITLVGYSFSAYIQNIIKENNRDDSGLKFKVYLKYADNNNVEKINYVDIYEAYSNIQFDNQIEKTEDVENEQDNEAIKEEINEKVEFDDRLIHAAPPEKTVLENAGMLNSNLDSMAEEYNEELIIQENENYVKYVLDLIYDTFNDGVSKQHKLNTICQLYNCSYQDIYLLYEIFVDIIAESPTTNPYEEVKNICTYITDSNVFKNKIEEFMTKKGLNAALVNVETEELINGYLTDELGNSVDILINTLYYKQIRNIPLETKLNYIYQRWGIDEKQLTVLIDCVLCEATHHSYIDAYAVTTTIMNRMSSKKWTVGYGDIYDQLTRRFGVYKRGDYKCYDGLTIEELIEKYEGAPAVIDCLFTELPIHNATNFYGNGYESKYRAKFTENGNNYFNENDQLSFEDRIPAEQVQQIIFDKNIILSFPKNSKVYPNLFETYFLTDHYIPTKEEDILRRIK